MRHIFKSNAAFVMAILVLVPPASAQSDNIPRELTGVDIIEHLNEPLPLDLRFTDEAGQPVALSDLFQDGRPVILTLNYYRCPMLCTLQLNGLVEGLRGLEWKPGEKFQIVTISFDPGEGPELASAKKQAYVKSYKPEAQRGWSFLTGSEESIRAITGAAGYGYKWNESRGEWAHPSAIMIATPDGRLSRYLYGITFETSDLKMALLEASEGKIGSTIDRFIMWCFHYDDTTGQYTPAIMRITQLFGALTVLVLGTGLLILWRRDAAKRRAADESTRRIHTRGADIAKI